MRYPLVSAALLVLLAACAGEGFDAGEFDVTGRWTGTALAIDTAGTDTARYEFDLNLTQAAEDISGSGQVRVRGQTVPVEVRGDFGFPNVDLRLSAGGFVPLNYDAAFRRDTVTRARGDSAAVLNENRRVITGQLTSSALNNVRLEITRQ